MPPYVTVEQIKARLGAETVRSIYDDNNNGEGDADPLEQLARDASSDVDRVCATIYKVWPPAPEDLAELDGLVTLTLDAAEYRAARRYPSAMPSKDWTELKAAFDKDIKNLRTGVTTLGRRPPDFPSNHGGTVVPGQPGQLVASFGTKKGDWGFF